MNISNSICLISLLLAPLARAQAEDRRVPEQYSTIQAAVDAAQEGDTVVVAGGVYDEDVFIEAKHQLTLRGGRHTRIGRRFGVGLKVLDSTGIVVRKLRMRQTGRGVEVDSSQDVELVQLDIRDTVEIGIFVEGSDGVLVSRCTVTNSGSFGIAARADRCIVQDSVVINAGSVGIWLEGLNGVIEDNQVLKPALTGIQVRDVDSGVDLTAAVVRRNRVEDAGPIAPGTDDGASILMYGSGNRALDNRVMGGLGSGIRSYGDQSVIQGNRVTRVGRNGLDVYGRGNFVSDNVIKRPTGYGIGLALGTNVNSGQTTVRGNLVKAAGNFAYSLAIPGNLLLDNRAVNSPAGELQDSWPPGSNRYFGNSFPSP